MIRAVLILLMLTGAVSAFQCNSADIKKTSKFNEKSSSYNDFFPLSDGNYWLYINEGEREESELFTVKAKDTKKVESGVQLKVSAFPYLTKEEKEQSLSVNSSGEIEAIDYFGATGIFVPAPGNFIKGYEWSFGIYKGYITRTGETVTTEAGKFENCIYVNMTDGFTFSFEMWYKKDVGIVKWGSNRTNPPTLNFKYYVLKEYKVN
jgi:hypothetical protein